MGSAGLLPREERQGACKAQCPSRIVPHQVRGTSRRWGSSPRCSTWCSIRCSTFCVVFRLLFLRKSFQINRLRTFWIYPHQPPQKMLVKTRTFGSLFRFRGTPGAIPVLPSVRLQSWPPAIVQLYGPWLALGTRPASDCLRSCNVNRSGAIHGSPDARCGSHTSPASDPGIGR